MSAQTGSEHILCKIYSAVPLRTYWNINIKESSSFIEQERSGQA